MTHLSIIPTLIVLSVCFRVDSSVAKGTFEFHLGEAFTFPTELQINQRGEEKLSFHTGWEAKGFEVPVYYSIRGGWQFDRCVYDIEMIHHKLHATDLPDEVQHFEISHGLNFILFNQACPTQWAPNANLRFRKGLGIAMANPDTTVRGEKWFEQGGFEMPIPGEAGYHPTGPFVQLALQKRFKYHFSLEGKWVGGYIDVPVSRGRATMWHHSLHLLLGLSF